ncbi:MAG: SPOR domain-containing protein [Desulfobacterales bacterium]|jgi:cell division septation protein DedD
MAKTKTRKPKPVWQLSRRGLCGGVALVIAACAWTFFLGVLVGRGTAPVRFDLEKLNQDLQALQGKVQQQQARQLQTYSAAVENKSDLDFYEDLKQSGENLGVTPQLTRRPPQPSPGLDPGRGSEAQIAQLPAAVPVKKRLAGLQPKNKAGGLQPPAQTKSAAQAPSTAAAGALTLQVAALRDQKTADEMVARLRRDGFRANRKGVAISGQGIWYRVQVGRFSDRQQAAQTMRALKAKGLKPILVSR